MARKKAWLCVEQLEDRTMPQASARAVLFGPQPQTDPQGKLNDLHVQANQTMP